jgi:hypothetical protein
MFPTRLPIKMSNLWALPLALAVPGLLFAGIAPVHVVPDAPAAETSPVAVDRMPAIFREGEDLTFAIKIGFLTGGYSSMKIQNIETLDGRPTYHVVAEARSTGMVNKFYPVNDRNEAWLQPQTPSTLRYARKIHEGKYRVEEEVVLDQSAHKFHQHVYRVDKNRYSDQHGDIPANVLDVLGSLYYVRSLPLAVGKTIVVDVHSEDKVFPLVVKVKKRQMVKVKAGKFDCFLVEPELRQPGIFVSKGKKLEVFMTADERHMPVLMRSEIFVGHVSAELISHRSVAPTETFGLAQSPVEH